MREEQEIFDELADLCTSPGYVHVIAHFCVRDNAIPTGDNFTPEDVLDHHSTSALIRTEISTLIGLLIKKPIDFHLPEPAVVQTYIEKTEQLLDELHKSLTMPWRAAFVFDGEKSRMTTDPFGAADAMREPIFYGGDSAYNFQYRDLAPHKYALDEQWLCENKSFSIADASKVFNKLGELQLERLNSKVTQFRTEKPDSFSILPAFMFTTDELAELTGFSGDLVEPLLQAFCVQGESANSRFASLQDYNEFNAAPLLRHACGHYIMFLHYSLLEALYESPFYWMGADKTYAPTALTHRGKFTEDFALERLQHVFGAKHVHANVDIFESKAKKFGEVDVLVLFGDRAIVLQAKSKRLTLAARKGNDLQLKSDFKKAVQDAYDQARECAAALCDPAYQFIDANGLPLEIRATPKVVYPICIVADHYPALNFQARQFLKTDSTDIILPPLVTDVFALDAIAEMLSTPLHFLNYIDLRAGSDDKILTTNEHTVLSFHLKNGLWFDSKYDLVSLDETIAVHLDVAMLSRRGGVAGARTPDGLLTHLAGTSVGRMVAEIEANPHPVPLDLGYFLLRLGEDSAVGLSRMIDNIVSSAKTDGAIHDTTVTSGENAPGLTVHCSKESGDVAMDRLASHCALRKHSMKAPSWLGVSLRPEDGSIRFGVSMEYPDEPDDDADRALRGMPKAVSMKEALRRTRSVAKIRRNDLCYCGSGRKYKHCCRP